MLSILPSSQKPTAISKSIPAPVGGWNARDPVGNMPPTDAIFLDNWFPRAGDVILRPGSALFATLPTDNPPGSPHDIRSLLSYHSPSGTKKLFAGDASGLYDVTAGGTIVAASSAATNGEWQSTMISTAGGSFLWCCNGVDKSRYFNGTAWTVLDGVSSPALTGVTSADVVNVSLYKTRLIFCVKNSLSFWYLPVNSVAGAASEFPLGAIFTRGGYLMATGAWTLDGGNGPEDYFVAMTSEGEVAVYAGTDPSSANTWALQGVYYIAPPTGRRCMMKLGGDLALLTSRGLFPLSKALQQGSLQRNIAISDKIAQAWLDYYGLGKSLYGWQPILYPEASFLLVNVPVVYDADLNISYSYQFVMNTETKAWCRFTNLNAQVWGTHGGRLFFANHNKVYEAWTGTVDVVGAIDGKVKTAFSYPAGRGNLAHVTLIRPTVQASEANVKVHLDIDTDYAQGASPMGAISYSQGLSVWDTAIWDESVWRAETTVTSWKTVAHSPGKAVAVRLRVLGRGITISWSVTDFIFKQGGML